MAKTKTTTKATRKKARRLPAITVAKRLAAAAPEGWTVTGPGVGMACPDGDIYEGQKDCRWVRFEREADGVRCVVVMTVEPSWTHFKKRLFMGYQVGGQTLVNGRSFTRLGIDSDSCSLMNEALYDNCYTDLPALLAGQFERCAKAEARRHTAVAVPGLPFTRQPEWFAKAGATLKEGRRVDLTPHGFGTGYALRRGAPKASRLERRATAELEAALGVSPVAVSTFDYD